MEIYYLTSSDVKFTSLREKLSRLGIKTHQIGRAMIDPKKASDMSPADIAKESVRIAKRMDIFPAACLTYGVNKIGRKWVLEDYIAYMDSDIEEPMLFTGVVEGRMDLYFPSNGTPKDHLFGIHGNFFTPKGHGYCLAHFDRVEYSKWEKSRTESQSAELQFVSYITERVKAINSPSIN